MDLYYDGECPFCTQYVKYYQLKAAVGQVRLHNLREHPDAVRAFKQKGYDVDKGMIVFYRDRFYHGHHAMALIEKLSMARSGWSGWLRVLLGKMGGYQAGYLTLTLGRRATLFVMGKSLLDDNKSHNRALLAIFSFALGVFFILHALVYSFQFFSEIKTITLLIAGCGTLLIFKPFDLRWLAVAVLVALAGAYSYAPIYSNHTILLNFLLLGMLAAGAWAWLRGGGVDGFVAGFSAVGRLLLLTMYFFGVFHKINSDFLNVSSSCARSLWLDMPFYWEGIGSSFWLYLGIYGTLLIEAIIFVCLLVGRLRWFGVLAGIAFHSLLAWSGYAMYAAFSMLTVCLHILFLSPAQASHILASNILKKTVMLIKRPVVFSAFFSVFVVMILLAYWRQYAYVGILWTVLMTPLFVVLLVSLWHSRGKEYSFSELLRPSPIVFLIFPALFFFNCFAPYLGLKTAQSMNMFANLGLEGGYNNHLVLRGAPWPFSYLDSVVEIVDAHGAPYLRYIKRNDLRVVPYDLVDYLERNRNARTTFRKDGQLYEMVSYQELPLELKGLLHPRWFRAWFHFTPVDVTRPKSCALDR